MNSLLHGMPRDPMTMRMLDDCLIEVVKVCLDDFFRGSHVSLKTLAAVIVGSCWFYVGRF